MITELFPILPNPEEVYRYYQQAKLVKLLRMRRDAMMAFAMVHGRIAIVNERVMRAEQDADEYMRAIEEERKADDRANTQFTFTGNPPTDPVKLHEFNTAMQTMVNLAVEMHRKEQAELNERLRVAFTIANGGIEPSAEEVMLRAQRLIHPNGKEAYTWDGEEVIIVNERKLSDREWSAGEGMERE